MFVCICSDIHTLDVHIRLRVHGNGFIGFLGMYTSHTHIRAHSYGYMRCVCAPCNAVLLVFFVVGGIL